jgi:hypothetical protein
MPRSPAAGPALSRRSFLAAASAAGVALLVSGCTSDAEEGAEPVTAAQHPDVQRLQFLRSQEAVVRRSAASTGTRPPRWASAPAASSPRTTPTSRTTERGSTRCGR